MAKEDKAKVKMTVIHFETESDNATLQENIRAIAHTLTRALSPTQRIVHMPQAQLLPSDGTGTDSASVIDEETDDLESDAMTTSSNAVSPKKKGRARQHRRPETLDIDLITGDPTLKDFLDQKNPEGDLKKYLAIAYWLRKYRNIEEVTADHAYTCYRHMGWQVPADASQPFRNAKTTQYGWMRTGSTKGTYSINHIGENVVERMGNE